jgi:thymidylate synthase
MQSSRGELLKVRASTLDDLLRGVFDRLTRRGRETSPNKGRAFEITGVVLELTNPRARLSRTEARNVLFGCLGELLWYLAGDDSLAFIRYYLPNYDADSNGVPTLRAAYGPRLKGPRRDLLGWVVRHLRQKPESRRAVIPIYSVKDTVTSHPEVPCTCTLQFLLRRNRLELLTHMRSNDAFTGLPNDVFAFTMMQEMVARALNVEIGEYKHLVGSLHLYESDRLRAERFLAEGWQKKAYMPSMPFGDQFDNLKTLLRIEKALRSGKNVRIPDDLPEYWQDIAQLLRIHREATVHTPSSRAISRLKKEMHSGVYEPYIDSKYRGAKHKEESAPPPEGFLFAL